MGRLAEGAGCPVWWTHSVLMESQRELTPSGSAWLCPKVTVLEEQLRVSPLLLHVCYRCENSPRDTPLSMSTCAAPFLSLLQVFVALPQYQYCHYQALAEPIVMLPGALLQATWITKQPWLSPDLNNMETVMTFGFLGLPVPIDLSSEKELFLTNTHLLLCLQLLILSFVLI